MYIVDNITNIKELFEEVKLQLNEYLERCHLMSQFNYEGIFHPSVVVCFPILCCVDEYFDYRDYVIDYCKKFDDNIFFFKRIKFCCEEKDFFGLTFPSVYVTKNALKNVYGYEMERNVSNRIYSRFNNVTLNLENGEKITPPYFVFEK